MCISLIPWLAVVPGQSCTRVPHRQLPGLAGQTQACVVSFRNLYNQGLSGSLPDAWSALSQVSLEQSILQMICLVTICMAAANTAVSLTCQYVQLQGSLDMFASERVMRLSKATLCSLLACKQCCIALASAWPYTEHRHQPNTSKQLGRQTCRCL